jgi:predicted DNA-binding WGR domain protein
MIERNLFGTVCLVRNWGRIGTKGRSWRRSMPTNSRQDRR